MTMQPLPTFFNWSSGKDSALALYHLMQSNTHAVDLLLTTTSATNNRVSMHGLSSTMLQRQVEALGLPCDRIELPESPDASEYARLLGNKVQELKDRGYRASAFGDIFLEDLRAYRETRLSELGIEAVFPLWKRDTRALMEEFIQLGFKAVTVCVNDKLLGRSFVGRTLDHDFLRDLPEGVDPCGENGEYHTFCFDGPIFAQPVEYHVGEVVYREYKHGDQSHGYWFCDLRP